MPQVRYALVDTSLSPASVVEIDVLNENPGFDDHEQMHAVPPFVAVPSDEAQIGWTWTEGGGLKAG